MILKKELFHSIDKYEVRKAYDLFLQSIPEPYVRRLVDHVANIALALDTEGISKQTNIALKDYPLFHAMHNKEKRIPDERRVIKWYQNSGYNFLKLTAFFISITPEIIPQVNEYTISLLDELYGPSKLELDTPYNQTERNKND